MSQYEVRWPRVGAVVAVALFIGFLLWLLVLRDDDDSDAPVTAGGGPALTTEEELRTLADELGHPIYWAGPQRNAELEVEQTEREDVFLRYLTGNATVGDSREVYLTVGTYPVANAEGALREQAKQEGSLTNDTPDGGYVLTNEGNPTSVYIAYPGEDLQIEVYDPDPERAFDLATSGAIRPIE